MKRKNIRTTVNQAVDKHTELKSGLRQVAAVQPDPLGRQEISEGVYLIGGNGTYAMFIEMEDHVISVGGTAGIPDRIALLKEVVPNKPIKYGVMTHHHSDHIVGAGPYAEEGAEVIAAVAHEQVIRETTNNDKLKISTVKDSRTFESGGRKVEVIDIGPTNHTEHLLVAYLPKEGIVFQADHFGVRAPGDVAPANPTTKDFAAALKKHGIKAKSIVSAHSAIVASDADLKSALDQAKRLDKKS